MSSAQGLKVIYLTVFLDLLGFGMIIPILQLYSLTLGATTAQAGELMAVYALMQFLFAPLWGRLSDRIGRRPVLLVSIFGSCASQLGYALAPNFGFLMASRALAGACGANISAAQAYVADVTSEKDRAAALGLIGAALGLGFIFGPFFGGELGKISPQVPFFCASLLALVNFVLAFLFIKEPQHKNQGTPEKPADRSLRALMGVLKTPSLSALLLLFFVTTLGFSILEGVFSLFCAARFGYTMTEVGRLFALVGLMMVFAQAVLVRRLSPIVGERVLLLSGLTFMGAGLLTTGLSQTLGTLLWGLVLISTGLGLHNPSISSLLTRAAGPQKGSVLGVSQSLAALGRIIGPPLATRLLTPAHTSRPLLVAAGFLFGSLFLALLLPNPSQRSPNSNIDVSS